MQVKELGPYVPTCLPRFINIYVKHQEHKVGASGSLGEIIWSNLISQQ